MDVTHQVVIVGAGPAGMVTALLLGDLGVDCLVVDKRTQISPLPRARGRVRSCASSGSSRT